MKKFHGWPDKEGEKINLSGKVAIVTGASRGLGKVIAIELARAGALVVVAARTIKADQSTLPGTIHETVKEVEKLGGKAMAVQCDITQEQDVANMVEKVNADYGPVDILINNAGITVPESLLKLPIRRWDLVIAVNLRGTFLCTKMVLPQMVGRKTGNIINLSSVLAKKIKFSIVYGVTKAAIERFTLGLAEEIKRYNIAVNALCPDFTVTEAVTTLLDNVDTSGWQLPQMWGKYAVLVAAQDAQNLTGKILNAEELMKIFGPV